MKKRTFAFALATGLLLAGCASESPDVPVEKPAPDEEAAAGYVTINFINGGTRADDVEISPATADESSIENAALVFYCEDGSEFTRYVTNDNKTNAYWVNTDANHYGDKCAIVKLQKLPISVACVVNYETANYSGDLNRDTRVVSKYSKDPGKNFFMSSSKFYNENNELGHLTPVTPEMLSDTKEGAANNLDHPLVINVERYVAKVQIKNVPNNDSFKLENGELNPLTGENVGQVNAVVKFKPEFSFLTATSDQGYTIKKLPRWVDLPTDIQTWSHANNVSERWSSWVRPTTGMQINYETLKELRDANKVTFGTDPIYYAFDNNEPTMARQTSVVVAGKYTVKDASGNNLAADDGTFYLVAFKDNFEVYKTEADAIKAMGGEDNDVLVPEGVIPEGQTSLPEYEEQSKWTGWTGWMEIKGKDLPTRCIKYVNGYGYYAKPLNLVTFPNGARYDLVVRNHFYDVSIKGISGMGIGILDPNQPIIPLTPPDPKDQNYYLHMSVKVHPWRTVHNEVEWK